MKKLIIIIALLLNVFELHSSENKYEGRTSLLTVGFLQGGGGLIGGDYETLISEQWGLSVGIGLASYGTAIHYHFKPSITSHSLALTYWNQGFKASDTTNYLGLSYVMRSKTSGWSGQLGIGYVMHMSETHKKILKETFGSNDIPYALLYSIGYMF